MLYIYIYIILKLLYIYIYYMIYIYIYIIWYIYILFDIYIYICMYVYYIIRTFELFDGIPNISCDQTPGTAAESSGWPSTWSTCRLEMLKKSKGHLGVPLEIGGSKMPQGIIKSRSFLMRKPRETIGFGVPQVSEIPACLAVQLSHCNRTARDSTMVSKRMCVKLSGSNRQSSVVHCWVSTIIAG